MASLTVTERALRFAAGIISTMPSYSQKHPQEIYDWILSKATAGSEPTTKGKADKVDVDEYLTATCCNCQYPLVSFDPPLCTAARKPANFNPWTGESTSNLLRCPTINEVNIDGNCPHFKRKYPDARV